MPRSQSFLGTGYQKSYLEPAKCKGTFMRVHHKGQSRRTPGRKEGRPPTVWCFFIEGKLPVHSHLWLVGLSHLGRRIGNFGTCAGKTATPSSASSCGMFLEQLQKKTYGMTEECQVYFVFFKTAWVQTVLLPILLLVNNWICGPP